MNIATWIFDTFSVLGTLGLLLCLFLIFYIDAVLFPTLPELFCIIIFGTVATLEWGLICLTIIVFAEILGVSTLYFAVRKVNVPEWITSKVEWYMDMMIVGDEKAILANRVAPIIPFMGAFIALMKWSYGKSMLYLTIGGAVKYAVIIALAGSLYAYFETGVAQDLALALALIIIAISLLVSFLKKRKIEASDTGKKGVPGPGSGRGSGSAWGKEGGK